MNCEDQSLVQVKSKFEHEFRRFSVARSTLTFTQLRNQVLEAHCLPKRDDIAIVYLNPTSRGVAPLTDDASLASAIEGMSPFLRLFLQRRSQDGSAEYESGSDGHCSECSSDLDHEALGRGEGGGAEDRNQQSGPGGGGAEDRSQQSGSDGGGEVVSTAEDSIVGTHTAAQSRSTTDCSLGEECRPHNFKFAGSDNGSALSEASCTGRETLVGLSPSSGTSEGPIPEEDQDSSGGSEQSRVQASMGCELVGTVSLETPQPPGTGGKDSKHSVCRLETEVVQDLEAGEDDSSCALSGPRAISDERQGSSQLCQALPTHPLLAISSTSKPEPMSYPNTNAECGQESHPQTTLISPDDPVIRNGDTMLRVTADMLPPHPLLASSGGTSMVTAPPSNKTTHPTQHTTEDEFPYVVEIYDFDACLRTRDLLTELRNNYQPGEFRLKWVDDTHALGIFASSEKAWLATRTPYQQFKTRLVSEGTKQSRAMAEKLAAEMQPNGHCGSAPRPKHTAMVARRMVASALGMRVRVSPEQRQKESHELQQARANKQALRAALQVIPG